ncbi:MAG: hypothetical protein ICV62_11100 [Cyanobacteria bacterium Co-bin13]|nr:hypothetical protein [Cyanobacteria bacterium Co-bin13]
MGDAKPGTGGKKLLLNAFLDSDRSGNTDLGNVAKFAVDSSIHRANCT